MLVQERTGRDFGYSLRAATLLRTAQKIAGVTGPDPDPRDPEVRRRLKEALSPALAEVGMHGHDPTVALMVGEVMGLFPIRREINRVDSGPAYVEWGDAWDFLRHGLHNVDGHLRDHLERLARRSVGAGVGEPSDYLS